MIKVISTTIKSDFEKELNNLYNEGFTNISPLCVTELTDPNSFRKILLYSCIAIKPKDENEKECLECMENKFQEFNKSNPLAELNDDGTLIISNNFHAVLSNDEAFNEIMNELKEQGFEIFIPLFRLYRKQILLSEELQEMQEVCHNFESFMNDDDNIVFPADRYKPLYDSFIKCGLIKNQTFESFFNEYFITQS